jgi:hypothetical protein
VACCSPRRSVADELLRMGFGGRPSALRLSLEPDDCKPAPPGGLPASSDSTSVDCARLSVAPRLCFALLTTVGELLSAAPALRAPLAPAAAPAPAPAPAPPISVRFGGSEAASGASSSSSKESAVDPEPEDAAAACMVLVVRGSCCGCCAADSSGDLPGLRENSELSRPLHERRNQISKLHEMKRFSRFRCDGAGNTFSRAGSFRARSGRRSGSTRRRNS